MKSEQIRKLFGARVRILRQERNLTLREMAGLMGAVHSWVSSLEHGRVNATLETLTRLANAFGVDELDLLCFPELNIRHGCIEASRTAKPDELLDARNQFRTNRQNEATAPVKRAAQKIA